jgi:Lrp/AsnC family transcriptional regulator, regulator for asnA, asnC and gidA
MSTENINIDNLDQKILSILLKNARVPFLEVAKECNVSGAAIHQRVQRLVKGGVITGSEFTVDPQKIGYTTCAYMGIFLEKAHLYNQVAIELEKIPEIVECHYITGNYSMFIKIYAKNNDHLKNILNGKLQAISGILRTETFISLEESFRKHLAMEVF